jgi:hypothetical protein
MSLPTPPKYVVIPAERIEQAYAPDKPRRALLSTFIRILSLAWESKYTQTPRMNESELMAFLKLKRRQYFEQKADMELLGWLRSSHPVPGFVQFSFSRSIADAAEDKCDKSHLGAKKHTDLRRIEEEDSLNLIKNKESSSSSSEEQVRKTALVSGPRKTMPNDGNPKMHQLIDNLHLVFDPETYSILEWRDEFAVGIPARVLGWIAKAYQDRERLTQGGGPLGLIVKHILEQDAPHRYFLANYAKVLPESFLEAVREIEFECAYCPERFGKRDLRDTHQLEAHPNPCEECHPTQFFQTAEERKAHYEEAHDPYRVRKPAGPEIITMPTLDGSVEKTWQAVLSRLQEEMPRASFETWVRDSKAVRYGGNALTIGTRNSYARDWLTNRLTARVNQLLSEILQQTTIVVFVVQEDAYV